MRDLLNEARWATAKAGGKWRDLRRIKPNPATGVLAFVFRAGCEAIAGRVAEAMRDSLPCCVTAVWDCES